MINTWDQGALSGFALRAGPKSPVTIQYDFEQPVRLGPADVMRMEWASEGPRVAITRVDGHIDHFAVKEHVIGADQAAVQFVPLLQDETPRCWRCGKAFARRLTRPWHVDCPRCKAQNKRDLQDP